MADTDDQPNMPTQDPDMPAQDKEAIERFFAQLDKDEAHQAKAHALSVEGFSRWLNAQAANNPAAVHVLNLLSQYGPALMQYVAMVLR